MSITMGYVRVAGPERREDAVQWWYYWEYPDGWAFARGGRCRTIRDARHWLRTCNAMRDQERKVFEGRPDAELLPDGSLREIARSPYEAVR